MHRGAQRFTEKKWRYTVWVYRYRGFPPRPAGTPPKDYRVSTNIGVCNPEIPKGSPEILI
jgi:hypothetical protein